MTDDKINQELDKWLASGLSMANFLALANANGMRFPDVLVLHREMLLYVGRSHVKTWGPADNSSTMPHDYDLKDGAYYVLFHLQRPEEWETATA